MPVPKIHLKPGRVRPFHGMHPWVFVGAIDSLSGEPADGDEVEVVGPSDQFIARGIYNSRSKIRVRLYSWTPDQPLDETFFRTRLETAVRHRHETLGLRGPGSAARLVFSEADGLSGVAIDRYDQHLCVQFTSLGMAVRRDMWVQLLRETLKPASIMGRTDRGIRQLEGLDFKDEPLWGEVPSGPIEIEENGLRFLVNLVEGQKTGYYLDQRDNRQAVARLAAGKSILDAFCYAGGFSLHALKAGATSALGLDVSAPALALAQANAESNGLAGATFDRGDVFGKLAELVAQERKFGVVVLDPPKFARAASAIDEALRGYRRLLRLAFRLLEADGILVMCCCSGIIDREQILEVISQEASNQKILLQILENRGAAPDHPISVSCPETNYLKCIICRVADRPLMRKTIET